MSDQKDRLLRSDDGSEVQACPDPECKGAHYAGMHFTGGYSAQGDRYYREFDDGCPWADSGGAA